MAPSSGNVCVLLLLSVLRASNGAIISPGGELKGPRAVISFTDHQTTEDRSAYLQRAQEQGYTCWMFPTTNKSAVCIQNTASIYSDLPESGEALRLTLAKVSLRAWLPSFLCLSPPIEDGNTPTLHGMIDHNACLEVVEAALVNQPDVEVTFTDSSRGDTGSQTTVVRVAVDDTPWLKAMQSYWTGWGGANDLGVCSAAYISLASLRAKMQLRPTLWALAGGENGAANTAGSASITTSLAVPSATRIQSLLSLIDGENDQETSTKVMPSLRMAFPKPGGRLSGGVVPFIGEVVLGAAVTVGLDSGRILRAAARRLRDDDGSRTRNDGDSWEIFERHKDTMLGVPDFDRCEVRVVLDDAVASIIPVAAAASADGSGTSDSAAAVTISATMVPNYERKTRCTEHPAKPIEAEAAEYDMWANHDQVGLFVATRAIDRVCTRETFGVHRIYGELACRRSSKDGAVGEQGNKNVAGMKEALAEEQPSTPLEEGIPPPQPETEPNLQDSYWEVLATSAVVEYFHTGNLVDMLSPNPWATAAEEENYDTGNDEGAGSGDSNLLLTSPPEDLSLSLYLENDPTNTLAVVAVPRWLSDGEVWEAAYSACKKSVGPWQGILVNTNDCVDLVTSAVAAKRVDLFHSMSLRLMAYLESVNPNFSFEGHTGGNPEKVEALGEIPREGGGSVRTICEVGFNAGHSSLNWLLSSHPSTKILAFDLGQHDYINHALGFLQAVFPGRLELVVGDSRKTVPAHALAEETAGRDPHVCDVVFVDGDHTEEGAHADLVNLQEITSRDWHVLAIDDLELSPVDAAWRRFREDGLGRLERVVKAAGEHYAHSSTDENGNTNVVMHNAMHSLFMQFGHTSLGIGRYLQT